MTTTVLSLQPAPTLPANNHENAAPYVNGYVRHDSPEPSHRSTHSASSGEGLSMRDTSHDRNRSPLPPARSKTQVEANGAPASRRSAVANGVKGDSRSKRPRGQLQRANTDYGPRARSPPKNNQVAEENWELRHGWEDEYNSDEILAKLSTVSAVILSRIF